MILGLKCLWRKLSFNPYLFESNAVFKITAESRFSMEGTHLLKPGPEFKKIQECPYWADIYGKKGSPDENQL